MNQNQMQSCGAASDFLQFLHENRPVLSLILWVM